MTQNEVLLDVNVFPDYGQVRIEDLGTKEVPDGWGVEEAFIASEHAVYVLTMTADESDMANRGVRVRVLRGSDQDGLGELIFNQPLTFDSQILAVGEILDVDDNLHKVQLPGRGPYPVRIFTASNIPSEELEWPIEGATEINIVI
ncbi:hypothetical protein DE4585_03422 [Mycobacteroides salmoniphilum]|uniref:Uncharacterized protein n=1 Tax=Mycobacteroides salmoniphilum TaxID=404941 RepID=A0A4R8S3U6_9MYCO|nr:hypothetical protein [Mycobacteroides salmoniphilum]TDZ79674.1 hypothetical protein DE4585_03422 [Mycobacteroides salmoniphilum]